MPPPVQTEQTPLLGPAASTTLCSTPTPAGGVVVEDEKHYNLVGLSKGSFWILCLSMWICSFLGAFDGTVVATLLGPISSSFRATNEASWLGTSYMLSVCCFTPIYGRLCNIIGRQPSILIALFIFAVGNICCAIAPNLNLMIAARALAGMGGGGLSTVGSTIMSDIVPISYRGIFQGYANIMFGLGSGLGAPLGGIINDTLGWRWAFYLQIPFFFLAAIMIHLKVRYTLPDTSSTGKAATQTPFKALRRIDFLGCLLLAFWVGTSLIAISLVTNSTSASSHKWSDPAIIGLFIASAIGFVIFLLVELRWAAEPVMPFELLGRPTCVAVGINNFLISVVVFGIMYTVPLYFTAVRQMTPAQAGRHLIPNALIGTMGSLGCGFLVRHTGKYYWFTFICGLTGLVGCALIATWGIDTSEFMLWTNFSFVSFSMGAVTTLTVVALIADVGREHVAIATSLSYVSRTIGQVLGVALSGALTQSVLQKQLQQRITGEGADAIITSIRESSSSIRYLSPALKDSAIISYQHALHAVFIVAAVLQAVSVLAGLGMGEVDMSTMGMGAKAKVIDREGEDA